VTDLDETLAEGMRRERREAVARMRAAIVTGADLRFARKALGLRAAELAVTLEVTPETVSRWETDARPIPRTVRLAVVALLMLRDAALTERESTARQVESSQAC
jgi:DNA-binding transcriptional regulator YiaG